MGDRTVRVVAASERVEPPGPVTPGMHREQAIAEEGVWLGTVRTDPGTLTGWHHHGTYDTYIYVVDGSARIDYDDGGFRSVGAEPGDFVHIPAGVVHREGSAGAGVEGVLLRIGEGEVVFNVEGPASDA